MKWNAPSTSVNKICTIDLQPETLKPVCVCLLIVTDRCLILISMTSMLVLPCWRIILRVNQHMFWWRHHTWNATPGSRSAFRNFARTNHRWGRYHMTLLSLMSSFCRTFVMTLVNFVTFCECLLYSFVQLLQLLYCLRIIDYVSDTIYLFTYLLWL